MPNWAVFVAGLAIGLSLIFITYLLTGFDQDDTASCACATCCAGASGYPSPQPRPAHTNLWLPIGSDPAYCVNDDTGGVYWADTGGVYFSDTGGAYFSDTGGVYFSDTGGIYFSDTGGVYFSDTGGVYFSDTGGVYFSDTGAHVSDDAPRVPAPAPRGNEEYQCAGNDSHSAYVADENRRAVVVPFPTNQHDESGHLEYRCMKDNGNAQVVAFKTGSEATASPARIDQRGNIVVRITEDTIDATNGISATSGSAKFFFCRVSTSASSAELITQDGTVIDDTTLVP